MHTTAKDGNLRIRASRAVDWSMALLTSDELRCNTHATGSSGDGGGGRVASSRLSCRRRRRWLVCSPVARVLSDSDGGRMSAPSIGGRHLILPTACGRIGFWSGRACKNGAGERASLVRARAVRGASTSDRERSPSGVQRPLGDCSKRHESPCDHHVALHHDLGLASCRLFSSIVQRGEDQWSSCVLTSN